MPVLNAANLKALNEMQMKTMPKEQRRDAMMKLAQMKIAAQEDASHLLSQLATDLDGNQIETRYIENPSIRRIEDLTFGHFSG